MRRGLAYLPTLGWAAVLLWAGGQSDLPTAPVPMFDKVSHFLAYGVLGISAGLGWRRAGRWPRRAWLVAFALSVAALDEIHQTGVAQRTGDFNDWIADAAGFTLALLITTHYGARASGRGRARRHRYPGTNE